MHFRVCRETLPFVKMLAMRTFPLIAGLLCCLASGPLWAQELRCVPCGHAFGNVQVGHSSSFSIKLSNVGRKALRITSKSKQGSDFSFGDFPLPANIEPAASIELPVIFKPTATRHVTGVITIVSTALDPR